MSPIHFLIVVEGFGLHLEANEYIEFKKGDVGTRNAATGITPANLHFGSGNSATGTFEKGVDLAGGSATLNGGITIDKHWHATSQGMNYVNLEQDFIIPKNQTLTIYCETGGSAIDLILFFNYHSKEVA